MLGWDVTDFGSKDFEHIGRTLFTLRNGNLHDSRYPTTAIIYTRSSFWTLRAEVS